MLTLFLGLPSAGLSQETGNVAGRILSSEGESVSDADVRIREMGRLVRADSTGSFLLQNVRPGSYILVVTSERFGAAAERVAIEPGVTTTLDVTLSLLFHVDEILVTTGARPMARTELAITTDVVGSEELIRLNQAQLGETLSSRAGINSTYFGPGASRPVIRGFGSDRVLVLSRGIGVGDASAESPDHAVSVDALASDRIEIIRGPATLLYGGSAVGGIVNVIDGRIPDELPTQHVTGQAVVFGGSVANEFSGGVRLDGALGRFAWHADGLLRSTGDYSIPGFADAELDAESEHDHAEEGEPDLAEDAPPGVLPNSALDVARGALGVSYIGQSGYFGASFYVYDTHYGVPGHGHVLEEGPGHEGEEENDPLAGANVDLLQRRFDLEGTWLFASDVLRQVKARFGLSYYRHFENEGDVLGTTAKSDNWETRLELVHAPIGPLDGEIGAQFGSFEFSKTGIEEFVPPADTDAWSLFLFEQGDAGRIRYSFGGRFEHRRVLNESDAVERTFDGASFSAGIDWRATDPVGFAVTGGRAVKMPSATELFADGPHLATGNFEVGNPLLNEEVSYYGEASLRLLKQPVTGSITGFVNSFDDFIFLAPTGEEELGLPVFVYVQSDAVFTGFEAEIDAEVWHLRDNHLGLYLVSDYVRASVTEGDVPLPRIPPFRIGGGARFENSRWRADVGVKGVAEQDRTAPSETPTPGYTMFKAAVSYRFFFGGVTNEVLLSGTNLTNEMARNHVSFLKDVAPLPGRDLRITYRLAF